jgi:hypothetical protein
MAAPTVATDLVTALLHINGNIHSLNESGIDLKARLATWRTTFFPLIDIADSKQAFINRWIVSTIALEQELASVQVWFEVERIINLMNSTLAAARWNGFIPGAAQEAAMVAAFNGAWT